MKRLSIRSWPRSLAFRVVAFSTVWAIVALIVIFTLITTLYRQASERGFDSLLSAHLFNLISSVGISDNGELTGSPDLGDLRFSEPNSGWYWSVLPASEGVTGERHSSSMTEDIPCRARPKSPSILPFSGPIRPTASTARNCRSSKASSCLMLGTTWRAFESWATKPNSRRR